MQWMSSLKKSPNEDYLFSEDSAGYYLVHIGEGHGFPEKDIFICYWTGDAWDLPYPCLTVKDWTQIEFPWDVEQEKENEDN